MVKLPRHCDEPKQILMWSMDEAAPLFILFVFGFIVEQTIIFSVIGLYLVKLFGEWKDGRPDGYPVHLLYWYGVGVTRGFSMDNPFRRKFYR